MEADCWIYKCKRKCDNFFFFFLKHWPHGSFTLFSNQMSDVSQLHAIFVCHHICRPSLTSWITVYVLIRFQKICFTLLFVFPSLAIPINTLTFTTHQPFFFVTDTFIYVVVFLFPLPSICVFEVVHIIQYGMICLGLSVWMSTSNCFVFFFFLLFCIK